MPPSSRKAMPSPKLYSVSSDEVYFVRNACLTSWAGVVDDEFSISESGIRDFICGSNPDLYERLRGFPAPTYSLTGDEVLNQNGDDLREDLYSAERQDPGNVTPSTTEPAALAQFPAHGSCDVVLTVVDSVVLGDFTFTLHHHDDDYVICCLHPTCSLPRHVVPKGRPFGGVRCNSKKDEDQTAPSVDFYCSDCLDDVIKLHIETTLQLGADTRDLGAVLDGTPKPRHILQAAERIHPELSERDLWKMYYPTAPPLEAGTGSNSRKGVRLRRQKQYEIKRLLQKVRKDQFAQLCTPDPTEPGSLVLVRPRNLPIYEKRYKKQGREWTTDRGVPAKPNPILASTIAQPIPNRGVTCYCGEPSDGWLMVQCSSDYCMFGLIHWGCTNLKDVPCDEGQFVCRYCQTYVVIDGKILQGPRAWSKDRTGTDITASDTDDGESGTEMASSEHEDQQETSSEDGDYELEEGPTVAAAASRFIAVNSALHPSVALPEMEWTVSDQDMDNGEE